MNSRGVGYLIIIILFVIAVALVSGLFAADKLSFFGNSVEFTYTHSHESAPLFIGSKTFEASPLQYVCRDAWMGVVRYPAPRKECWKATASYGGATYNLIAEKKIRLDEFISVTLYPNGKATLNNDAWGFEKPGDWSSRYVFEVDEKGLLSSIVYSSPEFVKLNTEADALVGIENELAGFDKEHSGIFLRANHGLLEKAESWKEYDVAINEGESKYLIPLDTSELGKVNLEIQPFLLIDADDVVTLKQNQPIKIQYEVVKQIPTAQEEVSKGFLTKIWEWIKGWFN